MPKSLQVCQPWRLTKSLGAQCLTHGGLLNARLTHISIVENMATAGRKPGGEKTGGRKAGTLNKKTLDLIAILEERGYSPVAELIEVGAIARKEYERSAEIFDAIQDKRASLEMVPLNESDAPTYLKIMQSSAAELMPYLYPKRKAIELTAANGADLFQSFAELVKQVADDTAK